MNGLLANATDAALNQAAARPFSVILQVEQGTQMWIAGLLLAGVAVYLFHK